MSFNVDHSYGHIPRKKKKTKVYKKINLRETNNPEQESNVVSHMILYKTIPIVSTLPSFRAANALPHQFQAFRPHKHEDLST